MMYDRMKNFLQRCLDMVAYVLLFAMGFSYLALLSATMTGVVNQLRLDTYVGIETGFGIVTLIMLLGWVPYWLCSQARHRGSRY